MKIPDDSKTSAQQMDSSDPLYGFRNKFVFPRTPEGIRPLYFAGHSLGLMPKLARDYVNQELDSWESHAVEGHFEGPHPWLPYHENITPSFARLVGAKPTEVVAMNSLTVNLHLMMVSFYRPTRQRNKVLIEGNSFPSDKYAVDSQVRFHGHDPSNAVLEIFPRSGEDFIRSEDLMDLIERNKSNLALVLLGQCNYLSGQAFQVEKISQLCKQHEIAFGLNLAHGAGNLSLSLHDWGVDFAVWCSYKYLNSGPGGIAGAFVHQRHHSSLDIPKFAGWWGTNKQTRFKMGPHFDPIPSVESWQLSNPPIFQLASLRASMDLFDQAGISNLRDRGDRLTSYFEFLLEKHLSEKVKVITPPRPERGSMLCLRFATSPKSWVSKLKSKGTFVDFREPDIIRATPAPLYNSFEDVYDLVQVLKELSHD